MKQKNLGFETKLCTLQARIKCTFILQDTQHLDQLALYQPQQNNVVRKPGPTSSTTNDVRDDVEPAARDNSRQRTHKTADLGPQQVIILI